MKTKKITKRPTQVVVWKLTKSNAIFVRNLLNAVSYDSNYALCQRETSLLWAHLSGLVK